LEVLATNQTYINDDYEFFLDNLFANLLLTFGKNSLFNCCRGIAVNNFNKYIEGGEEATPKKYLIVFQALMAGINILDTAKVEPNITELNKTFNYNFINKLITAKAKGMYLSAQHRGKLKKKYIKLLGLLDLAYHNSFIDEEVTEEGIELINKWLIRTRLHQINWDQDLDYNKG